MGFISYFFFKLLFHTLENVTQILSLLRKSLMGFITWFFYAFVFQCDWRLKPAEIRVCSEWPKSVNCTCINENLKKKRQENTKEIHSFMSLSNAFALILCQFLSWLFASLSFRFFFTEDAFDIISVLPIFFKLFATNVCFIFGSQTSTL